MSNIEIGSKWVKDGVVVEIKYIELAYDVVCIFFDNDAYHVLAEYDFLEQYKPYEPVYEYRFMYQLNDINFGEWHLHPAFYKTVEDCINYTTRNAYNFQRLDFTKRERKQ